MIDAGAEEYYSSIIAVSAAVDLLYVVGLGFGAREYSSARRLIIPVFPPVACYLPTATRTSPFFLVGRREVDDGTFPYGQPSRDPALTDSRQGNPP